MGSCLGTEKWDPSLAPWKGPKGLYPGEKFFSGKCHGARTVTLSGTCCANGCGAACEVGAGHVCVHQPCPGHTQGRLKWGPCSRSTWRWGQQGSGCFLCLDGVWGPGDPVSSSGDCGLHWERPRFKCWLFYAG